MIREESAMNSPQPTNESEKKHNVVRGLGLPFVFFSRTFFGEVHQRSATLWGCQSGEGEEMFILKGFFFM